MENLDSAESDKAVETACTTNPQNPANRTNETSVPNKIKPDEFSVVKAADTNSEDRIVIDDTDLPIQCSPPSKDAEEDLIVIQDGSPKNKSDSSKSKKGTGLRKRSAFSVSNPRAGESTSSDTEEHLVQTESLVSQSAGRKKAKTKLYAESTSEIKHTSGNAASEGFVQSSLVVNEDQKVLTAEGTENMDIALGVTTCSKVTSSNIAEKKTTGRQKAIAKIKSTSAPPVDSNTQAQSIAKTQNSSANAKPSTKAKDVLTSEDKDKKERLIQSEMALVTEIRVYCEYIPMLRPSSEELQDLDELSDCDGPLPIKIRQLISRFVEGRDQVAEDIISALKSCMVLNSSNAAEKIDFSRILNLLPDLVEYANCRPELVSLGNDAAEVIFVRRCAVKDMADFPEKFRSIVDVHRKMEAALKERMVHLSDMLKELKSGGKGLAKLEKSLVAMKDRYAKLEEREKKEREKLEIKIDADRKKMEEARKKLEESRKKQEEMRKKQEEKDEKLKRKDEESRKDKKEQEKHKDVIVSKQASFMANFFKKPSSSSMVVPQSTSAIIESSNNSSSTDPDQKQDLAMVRSEKEQEIPFKVHRNFHPWEKPKNAKVAGYPFGPGNIRDDKENSAAMAPTGSDLNSWILHWKKNPRPDERQRMALRENGSPHPRMKMIQLCMMVPVTRTQLVDVDIDASKKVIWDIEADPEEKQLQTILDEAQPTSDGLYRWKDKTLQFLTEGGGWFDSRRPPYFGTWSRKSSLISGRRPLARESELDYEYESDADWESEAGDGEELGSEVDLEEDGDDDMDADEDGGFVVPDGYSSDRDIPDGNALESRRGTKLQKIVYERHSLPADLELEFTVHVLDELPLVLCNDPNVTLENNVDFYGEDILSCRVPSLEAAIYKLHQHPTACSFTYIPLSNTDSKFAGHLFLKTANASRNGSKQDGMISGFYKQIPEWKKAAIYTAQNSANQHACKDANTPQLSNPTDSAVVSTSKQCSLNPVQVTEEQVKVLLKLAHGSKKAKVELVEQFALACPGLSKKRAFKIFSQVTIKKSGRWTMSEETLSKHPSIADLAVESWRENDIQTLPITTVSEAPRPEASLKAPTQQQLIFRPLSKLQSPDIVHVDSKEDLTEIRNRESCEGLKQFGCLPV